jgi:hypothetical protein
VARLGRVGLRQWPDDLRRRRHDGRGLSRPPRPAGPRIAAGRRGDSSRAGRPRGNRGKRLPEVRPTEIGCQERACRRAVH